MKLSRYGGTSRASYQVFGGRKFSASKSPTSCSCKPSGCEKTSFFLNLSTKIIPSNCNITVLKQAVF